MDVEYSGGNLLLDRLPVDEQTALAHSLEQRSLGSGDVLYPGRLEAPFKYVHFPNGAVASMLVTMADGTAVEAGTVGREGMVGAQVAFGTARILERWIAQVPGLSARMTVDAFREHYDALPTFRTVVHRFVQSYMASLAQSVACNRLHVLVERCARWLLLSNDRAGRDDFSLTHEYLAIMLGVQRPSVSVALATLSKAGFIRFMRGNIIVIDRVGLESASCECYPITTANYERLLGEIGEPSWKERATVGGPQR